jgi:Tfp pilus assembly protein PilX
MSTALIIVLVVAAIVLLALLVLGGKKRKTKKQRIEAGEHRSEAQIRRQRAERELAQAREQEELATPACSRSSASHLKRCWPSSVAAFRASKSDHPVWNVIPSRRRGSGPRSSAARRT